MIESVRQALRGKTLSLGIGVVDHFLFASLGPSLDHLTALGQGPMLLDAPRLSRLKEAVLSGKPLTGAYYFSESYLNSSNNLTGIIEILPFIGKAALKDSDNEAAKQQFLTELSRDAKLLADDMARLIPRMKDRFGYGFLTDQGIEAFAFDNSEQRFVDDSKPLRLLAHAGDQPAVVVVERSKGTLEQFAFLKKWSQLAFDYAVRFIPKFGGESAEVGLFLEQLPQLRTFAETLSRTTEEKLLPAMLDGEVALVIDFAESRQQWHQQQPTSSKPLPALSLAMVMQVNDMNKLKQAGADYFKTAEAVLDWLRGQPKLEIPEEFNLSAPDRETTARGEIYSYPLPAAAQLDESIVPHALLGNGLLIFSYFPQRSNSLVSEHRPNWRVPLDWEHPASAAWYFDANEFVDAANTWGRYLIELQESGGRKFELKNEVENDQLNFERAELFESWDQLIEFLKCFRGMSMLRYSDGDATISHYRLRFVDIPK